MFDYDRSKISATFVQKFEPDVSTLLPVVVPNLLISRGTATLANYVGKGDTAVDVSGSTYHAMIYGASSGQANYQVVVTKRSSSGAVLWSKTNGNGPYFQTDHTLRIVLAPNGGGVYVLYCSVSQIPIYVYKVRYDGVLDWARIITTDDDLYNDFQWVQFIAANPITENIYIGAMTGNVRSRVLVLSKDGALVANKMFVSPGAYQYAPQICFDSSGNAFVAANYYAVSGSNIEIRVIKLDTSHAAIASRVIGGSGSNIANASDSRPTIAFDGSRLVISDRVGDKLHFVNASTLAIEYSYSYASSVGEISYLLADGGYVYALHEGGGNVKGYVSKINPSGAVEACKRFTKITESPNQGLLFGELNGFSKMPGKDYFACTITSQYTNTPPGVYAATAFGLQPGTFTIPVDSYGPSITVDDVSFTLSSATSPSNGAGYAIQEAPAVAVGSMSITPVDVGTTIGWVGTVTPSTFTP
jgi:hypothetical protein